MYAGSYALGVSFSSDSNSTAVPFPTDRRVAWVGRLSAAGVTVDQIEVAALAYFLELSADLVIRLIMQHSL